MENQAIVEGIEEAAGESGSFVSTLHVPLACAVDFAGEENPRHFSRGSSAWRLTCGVVSSK
ncbi:hypothetical protein AB0M48_25090 [Lentzea sp. NPDC051208]|uniref:hypothetical protein n=1 Tax=Lentzea sp. NPDC051208 TaxID=3154642 RepID=UPI0034222AAC